MSLPQADTDCQSRSTANLPPAGQWFWIDSQVIRSHLCTLTPAAVKVYLAIAVHTDAQRTAFPSVNTLASLCGISKRSVQRGVAELEDAGLVRVDRSKVNGIPQPNHYTLPPHGDRDSSDATVLACHDDSSVSTVLSCHQGSDTRAPITRSNGRRSRKRDDDDDGDFLISWEEAQALAQVLWEGGLSCMTAGLMHEGVVVHAPKAKFMPTHHKRRILAICGLAIADQLDEAWLVDAAEKVAARRPKSVAEYFRKCVRTTAAAHGVDLDRLVELVRVPDDFPKPNDYRIGGPV